MIKGQRCFSISGLLLDEPKALVNDAEAQQNYFGLKNITTKTFKWLFFTAWLRERL